MLAMKLWTNFLHPGKLTLKTNLWSNISFTKWKEIISIKESTQTSTMKVFFAEKLFPQQSFIVDVQLGSKYISTCLEHNIVELLADVCLRYYSGQQKTSRWKVINTDVCTSSILCGEGWWWRDCTQESTNLALALLILIWGYLGLLLGIASKLYLKFERI